MAKKGSTMLAGSNAPKPQTAKASRPQRLTKGHKHSNSEVVFFKPEPDPQVQPPQRVEKKRLLTPKV
jgi:hypothetical protein